MTKRQRITIGVRYGTTIKIGIVGAAGRGACFKLACDASDVLRIHAVCDVNEEKLEESRVRLGAVENTSTSR